MQLVKNSKLVSNIIINKDSKCMVKKHPFHLMIQPRFSIPGIVTSPLPDQYRSGLFQGKDRGGEEAVEGEEEKKEG